MAEADYDSQPQVIDREKVCPMFIRVFHQPGVHRHPGDYQRGHIPNGGIQIHTWYDATLKELSDLIKDITPDARQKGTFFDFAVVFPDPARPTYRIREIGSICSGRRGADDSLTLRDAKFIIGDYLDVAITPPAPTRRGPPLRGPPPRF